MRWLVGAATVAGLCFTGCLAGIEPAGAEIVVAINKSKQRMTVMVDGVEQHVWKVSTGLGGGPPSGTYQPERLARKWFSHKYNWSPMPYSIFFHKGYAIHGTGYVSRLGNRASHGCVRLHPKNAAALFDLVRHQGKGKTTIIISNSEIVLNPKLPAKPSADSAGVSTANALKAEVVEPAGVEAPASRRATLSSPQAGKVLDATPAAADETTGAVPPESDSFPDIEE